MLVESDRGLAVDDTDLAQMLRSKFQRVFVQLWRGTAATAVRGPPALGQSLHLPNAENSVDA